MMANSECQECKLYKLEAMSQGPVLLWKKAIHPEEKDYSTFLQTVNALMNEDGGGVLIHTDNPHLLDMFDQKVDKKLRELIPDNSPFLTWFDRQLLDRQHVFFRVKAKNGDRPLNVYTFNLKTPLNEGLCEPRYGEVTHRISEVLLRRPEELTEESSYESPVFKRGDEVVYQRDSGEIPFQECAWLQAKYFDCFSECNPDSSEGAKAVYNKPLPKNNTLGGNPAASKRSDEIVGKLFKHDLPGYISAFSGIYQFGGGSVYCGVKEEKGKQWKEQKKDTFAKKQQRTENEKKTTKSTVHVVKPCAAENKTTLPGTSLNKSSSDAKGNNCSPGRTRNNTTSGATENNTTTGATENNTTTDATEINSTENNATPGAKGINATSDATENNTTTDATEINSTENNAMPGAEGNEATPGVTRDEATRGTPGTVPTTYVPGNGATVFVAQEERLQGAKQEETTHGAPKEETTTNSKAEGHGIATKNTEIPHKEDTVFCCKGVHLSDDEKRQLTQTLERKLKHSLFWCGRSKPCKPIAFVFYKVGNPDENMYVFEVRVHYYHGLCFQSGRGPVAYKLLGEAPDTQTLENKEQTHIPDADKLKDEKERGITRYKFKEWAERCRITEEDILDEQDWDGIIDVQDRCGYNGMQGDACG